MHSFQKRVSCFWLRKWIEGETLQSRWQQQPQFSEAEVIKLLFDLLEVLAKVHSHRLIHRDIKPDNIILRKRDSKPVLIDFGIVKEGADTVVDLKGKPITELLTGTVQFAPPEQFLGIPVFASDLYSLGLTAICLLTGKWPRGMINPANNAFEWLRYAPEVSPQLTQILDKATRLDTSKRYQQAEDMRDALNAVLKSKRDTANQAFVSTVLESPPFRVIPPVPLPVRPLRQKIRPVRWQVKPNDKISPRVNRQAAKNPSFLKEIFNFPWVISLYILVVLYIFFSSLLDNSTGSLYRAVFLAFFCGGFITPIIVAFTSKRSAYVIGALCGLLFYQGCLGLGYRGTLSSGCRNNHRFMVSARGLHRTSKTCGAYWLPIAWSVDCTDYPAICTVSAYVAKYASSHLIQPRP